MDKENFKSLIDRDIEWLDFTADKAQADDRKEYRHVRDILKRVSCMYDEFRDLMPDDIDEDEDFSKCARCLWALGCKLNRPSQCNGPMTFLEEEVYGDEDEDLVEGIPGPVDSDCVG